VKALVQDRYGPLEDVLEVREVDRPTIADDEVLVRVRAASIHIGDVFGMRGVPYLFRPMYGLRRPKVRIPGTDVAGTVEAVGRDVAQLQPGDEVFGWCTGGFAEYASAPAAQFVPKPASLTFEEAATVGVSAATALLAMRDHGKVQPGQKVLINGASGGVGSFAVQIAKALGAEVTGVCSTRNVEMLRSIGADHVIDYTTTDFTKAEERYDLILDNVGNHSFADTRRALTPAGTLLSNGAPVDGWVGGVSHVIAAMLLSLFVRQQGRPFVQLPNRGELVTLSELAEAGKVRPVIDRSLPLSQGVQAVTHVAEGHARGTTIITM
jgi:NADPH:quinone reductase-like Zn-dependent oxidoreductase